MSKQSKNGVVIKVLDNLNPGSEKLFAYLTDKQGHVIEKVPVSRGEIALETGAEMFHGQLELYITGDLKAGRKTKVNLKTLKRAKAYQPSLKLSKEGVINIAVIPHIEIPFLQHCHITGNIKKEFSIDGEGKILPICNVRIHICEVDPWFIVIPRFPDYKIIDIRDRILDLIRLRKIPEPPLPDPPILDFPFPDPRPDLLKKFGERKGIMTSDLRKMKQSNVEMMMYSLPPVSAELVSGLASTNIMTVRKTLMTQHKVLFPYFCLWPWDYPLYTCDKIATVYPDCNGHFEHNYHYLPTADHPDIYIWIEALINGSWETVYKPGKRCGTYWNYTCGTDIDIMLTDARLRPCVCAPLPGKVVWIKRVNSAGVNIRNIQQTNAARGHISNGIGLTSFGSYNTSPFAKSFPLVVQFGSGFPDASIKNYRWKYKRIKDAKLNTVSETSAEYDNLINKYYTYEKLNSDGDTVFYTSAFKLGPEFTGNGPVYKIPHVDAAVDIPGEPSARWNQDTHSIYLNTTGLSDGLYEFKFELLNNSGNVVAVDPDVFVVTKKTGETSNPPDATTISADKTTENYLVKNGSGKAIAFKFVMRIDNQVCSINIGDAKVDGVAAHSNCGFVRYNDKASSNVELEFEANHPQDFAHYSFSTVRGNGNSIPAANVTDYITKVNNGYVISGDKYSKSIPVATMLGTCDKAAFAENLRIHATHTDGNHRIEEYDRYKSAAFALEPKTP